MMIGPAPMIRMLLMSLRLGMFIVLHHRHKFIKQGGDVMRPRRCFGVALEAERRLIGTGKTLQRTIKQRYVGNAAIGWQGCSINGETVILRSNEDLLGVQILHRMVGTMVTELHL